MSIQDLEEIEKKLKGKGNEKKKSKILGFFAELPLNYIIHVMLFIVVICTAILIWTTEMNARNNERAKLIERITIVEQLEKNYDIRMKATIHQMVIPEALK